MEFIIPTEAKELWGEGAGTTGLSVSRVVDLSGASQGELEEVAERITFQLYDRDPLGVVDQAFFDDLVGLVRAFPLLSESRRGLLVDGLASSLTCLTSWTDRALASREQDAAGTAHHRSALRAHVFFLSWLVRQWLSLREGDAASQPAALQAAKPGPRKRTVEGAAAGSEAILPTAVKAAAASLNTDLWALFRPAGPDEQLLLCYSLLATSLLDRPAACRDGVAVGNAGHVLSALALKYGREESVAAGLVELISTREHSPGPVADLLRDSVAKWGSASLASAVVGGLAAVDPAEYARQQSATGEKAGVRSVAVFFEELAARLPKLLARHVSLLLSHLGGAAHTLRSSIVTASGLLLQRAFEREDEEESATATAARLRGKQHLLDVLTQRVRDTSSYTRRACLAAWQGLAETRTLPLGHWAAVTDIAVGRLEDKSSLVRREALRLLQCLLLHNPFGPALPVGAFAASLASHRAALEVLAPDHAEDEFQGLKLEGGRDGATEPGQEGEQGGAEAPRIKPEPGTGEVPLPSQPAPSSQRRASASEVAPAAWEGSLEELKALVASLELATGFARTLAHTMPLLAQLLASASVSDVQETVAFLLTCKQFGVDGVEATTRRALPLVFSRDPAIRTRLVEAADQLFVTGWAGNLFTPAAAARNLMDLASDATLGELSSLAALVKEFVDRDFLSPAVVLELWATLDRASGPSKNPAAQGHETAVRHLRSALTLLSYVVAAAPEGVTSGQLDLLLGAGLGSADALAVRAACACLRALGPGLASGPLAPRRAAALAALTRALLSDGAVPRQQWYCAAGPAVDALFALHPEPGRVVAAALRALSSRAAAGDGRDLGPFFFLLGHAALAQLVYVDGQAKRARRVLAGVGRPAGQAKGQEADAEDINAELGVGSVAADAELEGQRERAEAEILGPASPLAPHARLVSAVCHSRALLTGDPGLRASALLCLVKLMAVDGAFCSAHLQLLFTLLQNRGVEPGLRSTLAVALGDLALRFPNMLEGWTERMYRPLQDADTMVRKNALMVLSHLILNDMMKVKGHIAQLAVCLVDPEPRIRALAELFFHELAKKEVKGTSPIYNLLPDILSNLSADSRLGKADFQSIMQALLGYIKKDKQGDALVEKLCQRFAASESLTQWHNVAFCLTQLPISDKGLRRLSESFKMYRRTLGDAEVAAAFASILAKAKRSAAKGDVKALVEELEARMAQAAEERAEQGEDPAAGDAVKSEPCEAAVSSLAGQMDGLKVETGQGDPTLDEDRSSPTPGAPTIKPDPETAQEGVGVQDLVAKFGGGLTLRPSRSRIKAQPFANVEEDGSSSIPALH
ncbi:hypothetical protein ACKKBF_B04955 [Auxenochlorella protothecoides x Auxenochlorella symbiontica]